MVRRVLRLVVVPLFLGVVTTVGVAWGCVLWLPLTTSPEWQRPTDVMVSTWKETIPEERWETPGEMRSYTGVGVVQSILWDLGNHYEGPWLTLTVAEAGFPFRALTCRYWSQFLRGEPMDRFGLVTAWRVEKRTGFLEPIQPAILPLRPVLPGSLINTLFYAALWLGLFASLGAAKRAIRRRRGRCVNCGYDLRGHVGGVRGEPPATSSRVRCPECGREAKR